MDGIRMVNKQTGEREGGIGKSEGKVKEIEIVRDMECPLTHNHMEGELTKRWSDQSEWLCWRSSVLPEN